MKSFICMILLSGFKKIHAPFLTTSDLAFTQLRKPSIKINMGLNQCNKYKVSDYRNATLVQLTTLSIDYYFLLNLSLLDSGY
jgi:hypothetical protein